MKKMRTDQAYAMIGKTRLPILRGILDKFETIPDSELKTQVANLLTQNTTNASTIAVRYSCARKLIKDEYPTQYALLGLVVPDKNISDQHRSSIEKRLANRQITEYSAETIDKLYKYGENKSFNSQCCFLMLTSGRRLSEVVLSKFKINNTSDNTIFLENPVKTHTLDYEGLIFNPLINNAEWIKRLRKWRSKIENKKANRLVHTITMRIDKWLKTQFPQQKITTHKLRHIYASYLFKFHNSENRTMNSFIGEALGHKSVNNSIHYADTNLDISEEFSPASEKK